MEFDEAKDEEARTAEEGCELMAVSLAVVANMWADAAQESAERMWKEHVDKPAADPKLVERIARQMSLADGNDPDLRCYRYEIAHLGGIARHAKIIPEEVSIVAVWTLYAPLAEAAIIEMEAVAMEPCEGVTITQDGGVFIDISGPEEGGPGELFAAANDAWSPPEDWQKHVVPDGNGGGSIDLGAIGYPGADPKLKRADKPTAPKDAPLIEALRKQREKEGF